MTNSNPVCKSPLLFSWQRLLVVGAVFILIAWLITQSSSAFESSSFEDTSLVYHLVVVAMLPWLFQWVGVVCLILGCCRLRVTREATLFAITGSFVLAAVWWLGVIVKFWGRSRLEGIIDVVTFEIQSHWGSSSLFDEMLFHVLGPILGSLQLRGPLSLQGWDFLLVMLSTTLMVGYLLFIGSLFLIKEGKNSATDYVKFILAILVGFLPVVIRICI